MTEAQRLTIEIIRQDQGETVFLVTQPNTELEQVFGLSKKSFEKLTAEFQAFIDHPSHCHRMSTYDIAADKSPDIDDGSQD